MVKMAIKREDLNVIFLLSNSYETFSFFALFATNFDVGCKYASYERHFVKKIQQW